MGITGLPVGCVPCNKRYPYWALVCYKKLPLPSQLWFIFFILQKAPPLSSAAGGLVWKASMTFNFTEICFFKFSTLFPVVYLKQNCYIEPSPLSCYVMCTCHRFILQCDNIVGKQSMSVSYILARLYLVLDLQYSSTSIIESLETRQNNFGCRTCCNASWI